jgi:hypothetical protein
MRHSTGNKGGKVISKLVIPMTLNYMKPFDFPKSFQYLVVTLIRPLFHLATPIDIFKNWLWAKQILGKRDGANLIEVILCFEI